MGSATRLWALVGATVLLALVSQAVWAHGAYITVDDQVSADGEVVVRNVHVLVDRYVVLYAGDDEPERIVGHAAVSAGGHSAVSIDTADEYWAAREGNVTVWVLLHSRDGDGRFDPSVDSRLESARHDGTRFTVRKSRRGDANVVPASSGGIDTDDASITLRRVELPTEGFVVLHADDGGAAGEVVGRTALDAGLHEGVDVAIDETFFRGQSGQFPLRAVVYADDGDGEFGPDDRPVGVGDSVVESPFYVRISGADDGPEIITPTAPESAGSGEAAGWIPFGTIGLGVALVAALLVASLLARRYR